MKPGTNPMGGIVFGERSTCAGYWQGCLTRMNSSAPTVSDPFSRCHAEHPFVFSAEDQEYRVSYLPAESDTGMFGGNSNWRGPIWMPVNGLTVRGALDGSGYVGTAGMNSRVDVLQAPGRADDDPCTRSRRRLCARLAHIFLRDEHGRRAGLWGNPEVSEGPALARLPPVLRRTSTTTTGPVSVRATRPGWAGIIARAMHVFATSAAEQFLELGKEAGVTEAQRTRKDKISR